MSQSEKMKKALLTYVVPKLTENGFCGEYPNYRRVVDDRIDIICFNPYPYGNAFYVDVSTVFPNRPEGKQNVNNLFFDGDFDNIVTGHCSDFYRLQGNFDDLFFYTDVYFCLLGGAYYIGVGENNKTFKPRFLDIRVQKSSPEIYKKVCDKINKQMSKAYKWWQKKSRKI